MLNFDMVGSPNAGWFVYDGDASDTASTGSTGSGVVEDVFVDFFESIGRATKPTAFDGRSDYDAFVAAGIPAGGLFTGAEDLKQPDEVSLWGGTAGVAYDPCYHAACDTLANVNLTALNEMSDALAHGLLTFAMTRSAVQGTARGNANGQRYDPSFRGHLAIRSRIERRRRQEGRREPPLLLRLRPYFDGDGLTGYPGPRRTSLERRDRFVQE